MMKRSDPYIPNSCLLSPWAGFIYALLATLALLACCLTSGRSQSSMTMYHMPQVPQSFSLNPGRIPLAKFYLGIPALSGTRLNLNTDNITYADIMHATDGEVHDFDFQRLNSRMGEGPLTLNTAVNLKAISLGGRTRRGFFQVEVSERVVTDIRLSRDMSYLFEDMQESNTLPVSARYDLSQIGLSGSYIRSYALGYAHAFTPRLSGGFRLHYLEGMAMVQADNEGLGIEVSDDPDKLALQGKVHFVAAGLAHFENFNIEYLKPGNKPGQGFAVDLGINFRVNDHFEVSFSALNLGQMTWKRELARVTLSPTSSFAEYFESTDLDAFNTGWEEIYNALVDKEENAFEGKIRQSLPTRFFAGAQILIGDRSSIGGVLETRHSEKEGTQWGAGASFNTRLGKIFGLSASLTHNSYESLGLGVGANLDFGPLQIYAVTDNLLAALDYPNASSASAQLGVNLLFGKLTRSEQHDHYAASRQARKPAKNPDLADRK